MFRSAKSLGRGVPHLLLSVFWAVVFLLALPGVSVQAMVISGGQDAANLSAPADDPGWARVGRVGTNGSGVYLGSGWVITANHVSSKTSFTVEGDTTYNKLPGQASGVRLGNVPGAANIDLYMFRVDVSIGNLAGLGDLQITSSAPSNSTQGVHISTGEGQSSSTKTKWYVDTSPGTWVWDTSPFDGWDTNKYGYSWAGDLSRDTRWSFQDVYDSNHDFKIEDKLIEGFATDFEESNDHGMAADNDSGSGFFVKDGSVWKLAGIAHSIGNMPNGQPDFTSVYGNWSLYSDLSAYSDQIGDTLALPEPIPGDFDEDGDVDGVDFGLWQAGYPMANGASLNDGDADGDGDVDGVDFGIWQANYPSNMGAAAATMTITPSVPEPAMLGLLLLGGLGALRRRKR